jgi:hypothetical protein
MSYELLHRVVPRTLVGLDDLGFVMLGLFAVTGFPLFHFLWNIGFALPDCLPPRVVGMALCLPLLLAPHLGAGVRSWLPFYAYIGVLYALPFFFVYHLVWSGCYDAAGDGSWNSLHVVWSLSTVSAFFLTFLLLDRSLIQTIGAFVVGSLAAFVVAALSGIQVDFTRGREVWPVVGFAVLGNLLISALVARTDGRSGRGLGPVVSGLRAPDVSFGSILQSCFSEQELRCFARRLDDDLENRLPGFGTSLTILSSEMVALVKRINRIDEALELLATECPGRRTEIEKLRRTYAQTAEGEDRRV